RVGNANLKVCEKPRPSQAEAGAQILTCGKGGRALARPGPRTFRRSPQGRTRSRPSDGYGRQRREGVSPTRPEDIPKESAGPYPEPSIGRIRAAKENDATRKISFFQ